MIQTERLFAEGVDKEAVDREERKRGGNLQEAFVSVKGMNIDDLLENEDYVSPIEQLSKEYE